MSLSPPLNKGIGTYRFPLRLAQETETRHYLPAWPSPPALSPTCWALFCGKLPPVLGIVHIDPYGSAPHLPPKMSPGISSDK